MLVDQQLRLGQCLRDDGCMREHPYLSTPPVAIAHRGGYTSDGEGSDELAQRQENTMAAFSGAVALGYRYLETDAHTTSDGVLISFHDDRLDRVTDRVGLIRSLAYADLREARIGGEYEIPTMEELFRAFDGERGRSADGPGPSTDEASRSAQAPGPSTNEASRSTSGFGDVGGRPVCFNVDLKANGAVVPMVRLVARLGVGNRVCVASFSSPRLWAFRALSRLRSGHRRAATSAGPIGVAALRLLPDALARWIHSPGIAYQVPVTTTILGREIRVVTSGFVRRAHALGKQVHVWTINDEQEMRELLDLGVDGIVTDRIDVLNRVLATR